MRCGLRVRNGRPEHVDFGRFPFVFLHVANGGVAAIALRQLRGADADRKVVDVAVTVEAARLPRVLGIEPSAFVDANHAGTNDIGDMGAGENLAAVVEHPNDFAVTDTRADASCGLIRQDSLPARA